MPAATDHARPMLHVVDADASVRDGLCRLAHAAGFEAHAHPSVAGFLASVRPHPNACVLLDTSLLQAGESMRSAMRKVGVASPIIMLGTAHDPTDRRRARSAGAQFLFNKPVDAQALFDAIAWVTEGASERPLADRRRQR